VSTPLKPAFRAWYTRSAVLSFFHAVPYTSLGIFVPDSPLRGIGLDRAEDDMVALLVSLCRIALGGFGGIRSDRSCKTRAMHDMI